MVNSESGSNATNQLLEIEQVHGRGVRYMYFSIKENSF